MSAGASGRREASAARERAVQHSRSSAEQVWRARCFDQGAAGEERTAAALDVLSGQGFLQLHDVSWPGTRAGNIDHLLVGPSGVFVLDSKNWGGDVSVRDGSVWQDQADRRDDLDKLRRISEIVLDVLEPLGLAPGLVASALVLTEHDVAAMQLPGVRVVGLGALLRWVLSRGEVLSAEQVAGVFDALTHGFAARETLLPILKQAPRRVEAAVQTELFAGADLKADELALAAAGPIESWMVWLHPDQRPLVRRHHVGPARIWGPPGTGKTVVAMHRMAYLAERRGARCLFLSHVRTLPAVLARRYARLSPISVNRVEFSGLHSCALRLLQEAGVSVSLDATAADRLFASVWADTPEARQLEGLAPVGYWKEEVSTVIRGRGLTELDQYLRLVRVGRRIPLADGLRRHVWQVAAHYRRTLEEVGVHDFDDVLRLAVELMQDAEGATYDVVVVDEAQDLTLMGVRLARLLAADQPNSLLLLGDGDQSMYPPGYTLQEAGLNVRGRSHCLRVNYRNTREILRFVTASLHDPADDVIGGEALPADSDIETTRNGSPPVQSTAKTEAELLVAMASHIQRALSWNGTCPGELAVLVPYRSQVERVLTALRSVGVPASDLRFWEGESGAVQVGTYARCKGLEFRYVYLPVIDSGLLSSAGPSDGALSERHGRDRRAAYVAGTRARDGLWFGTVGA